MLKRIRESGERQAIIAERETPRSAGPSAEATNALDFRQEALLASTRAWEDLLCAIHNEQLMTEYPEIREALESL